MPLKCVPLKCAALRDPRVTTRAGADPVERHLAFGEFWRGMPGMDNSTSPVVGALQYATLR